MNDMWAGLMQTDRYVSLYHTRIVLKRRLMFVKCTRMANRTTILLQSKINTVTAELKWVVSSLAGSWLLWKALLDYLLQLDVHK